MTVKPNPNQKRPCVHIWVNSQNRQLTDFDLSGCLPLLSAAIVEGLVLGQLTDRNYTKLFINLLTG